MGGASTLARVTPIILAMTKLLDQALEAVRLLPLGDQDEIARVMMQLAGADLPPPVALASGERQAIARSKAALCRLHAREGPSLGHRRRSGLGVPG